MNPSGKPTSRSLPRIRVWYACIIFIFAVCLVRLFYLQIIRHQFYETAAESDQFKEYQIPASRGTIYAQDGDQQVPIVLNHKLYTVYADPKLIKDPAKSAQTVADVLGGDQSTYEGLMRRDSRYSILSKKVDEAKEKALLQHKLPGVGAQAQDYRTYPQGVLASQLLGFVDDSGAGRYGIEQALNKDLTGKPGLLKAVTDINGVPLAASQDNVRQAAVNGSNVALTIDLGMQKQVEQLLKKGLDHAQSQSGSVVVLDPKTGAIKAMANFPTYNPADYTAISDPNVFNNAAATDALEVGSVMKPLTAAAALNLGVVNPDSTYYDPHKIKVDDAYISNIEEDGGPGVKNIPQILNLSLNTGATWLLEQMGGGQLDQKGRTAWNDYMVNHYRFGKETGIEQGYESPGYVPSPSKGYALNLTYANTAFGQAMTATMLQMSAAYAAMLNGGTYYQPHLVQATVDMSGKSHSLQPKVLERNVVSAKVGKEVQSMMEYVVQNHHFDRKFDPAYSVGGKTGTAQIADPAGGYYADLYNGTYVGFVGGNDPEYIIVVKVDKPKIAGYAGSQAAQPIFGDVAHMLLDNFNVTRKSE